MKKTHPCNVAASGSNAAHSHPDTSGRLRDEGTLLQCVIDPLNAVIFHSKQEATRHLTKGRCLYYAYITLLTLLTLNRKTFVLKNCPLVSDCCIMNVFRVLPGVHLESCGRLVPALKSVGEA